MLARPAGGAARRPAGLHLRAAARRNDDHAADAQRASRRHDAQVRRLPDALHAVGLEQGLPAHPGRRDAQAGSAHPSRPHRGDARQRRDGRGDPLGALLPAHPRRDRSTACSTATTSNPAFERFYAEHLRKLALVRGRSRYVSKAIMCVIRMQYLRRMFPDARFLLYVRNPIDHVASLIKQDRIWAELERDDPRQIEIIELTGHHEFGTRQVMANVGNPDELREIRRLFDDGRWAQSRARYWAYMYGFVLNAARRRSRAGAQRLHRALRGSLRRLARDDRPHPRAHRPRSAELRGSRAEYGTEALVSRLLQAGVRRRSAGARSLRDHAAVAKRFGYDVAEIAQRVGASPPEPTSV